MDRVFFCLFVCFLSVTMNGKQKLSAVVKINNNTTGDTDLPQENLKSFYVYLYSSHLDRPETINLNNLISGFCLFISELTNSLTHLMLFYSWQPKVIDIRD